MNNLESLLVFLFIGLVAGWLAGVFVKGRGFGVLGDILVGIVGAEIGGWIFGKLGMAAYGFGGAILMAFVGAVALLVLIKLVVNTGALRSFPIVSILLICGAAHASTTVTVDSNEKIIVTQPVAYVQTAVTPMVITRAPITGDFEGRIVDIDYSLNQIIVQDAFGTDRAVVVQPEMVNHYRIGDYVVVHPTTSVMLITMEENPRVFEGEIIRVDIPNGQIVVLDTNGRERKVQLKQGMYGAYKVDDYVRIQLMSDLKEAETIQTIREVRNLEGNIVRVDTQRSRIVVRSSEGKDNAVIVRQGQIHNYRTGDRVRIYLLQNREQVQVIRVI